MLKVLELNEGILFIEGERGGKYPSSNSLLIGEERFVLIDTGFSLSPEVVRELKERFPIEMIVNSHCHEDHVLMNRMFQECQICCHKLDAPAVRSVKELNKRYFTHKDEELVRIGEEFLRKLLNLEDSRVDFEFDDGYTFNLDVTEMKVIHTPGHSAGHCCFYFPNEKTLFLADIDLTSFGPWYGGTDSSLTAMISSIEKVKNLEVETAVTSHKGEVFRGGGDYRKILEEYSSKIWERERRILDVIREKWMTPDEIAELALIYGRFPEPKNLFKVSERIMIEKHLETLLDKGLVIEQKGRFKAIT